MKGQPRSTLEWVREALRYRIIHKSKFPKADLLTFCRKLATRGFYPRHIVDVGANKARWCGKVRRVFPRSVFTLLEPQIEMKPFLDAFCARSQGSRWINAGVAAINGELPFTVIPDTVSSSFTNTAEEAARNGWEQRSVPVMTLDHLCAEVIKTVPDMVKIDSEGFEHEIMQGAQTLLGKVEIFLLELQFFRFRPTALTFVEQVAAMASYGYVPYDFTTFQRRPYDGAVGLCELAFVREDGFLRGHNDWT